jgi:probable rRNA maturation factor
MAARARRDAEAEPTPRAAPTRRAAREPPAAPVQLKIGIQGRDRFADLPARSTLAGWLRRADGHPRSAAAARRGGPAPGQVVLRFVDAREGRRLNHGFRGRDSATNVLTFDYQHAPPWADIVICVPVARREAREQRLPLRDHLAHLVIHGMLHAQGHDHVRPGQANRMEAIERRLLAALGIPDPYREEHATP